MSIRKWPYSPPTGPTGPVGVYGDSTPWTDTTKRDLAFKWVMDTLTDGEIDDLKYHFINESNERVNRRYASASATARR